jgi:hypothetical protein
MPTHDQLLNSFTESQIEELRSAILRRDKNQAQSNLIDINNPPKQPYTFEKFPMAVYLHKKAAPSRDEIRQNRDQIEVVHIPAKLGEKIVHNEDELQAALAQGYSEKAPTPGHLESEEQEPVEVESEGHHSRKRK